MTKDLCISSILAVIAVIASMIFASGCVKQLDGMDENGEEYISFIGKVSKASPLTQLSGSAGVVAYIYEDWPDTEEGVRELTPWSLLEKKEFDFDGDRLSSASHDLVKWSSARSEGSKLKVFSYAPYGLDVTYNGTLPQIHYECKSSHNDHIDIITAISSEISTEFNQSIPLTFNHALTGIKFRSGFDEEIIVKSVSINNVLSKGVYTIGSGWSNQETAASFELNFDSGKKVSARGMISSDDEVLFLIPQDFINNQDASISLHCIVDGTEKTISTPLKGKRWEEGKMITYNLYEDIEDDGGENAQEYIFFDLAAGDIKINSKYIGYIYVGGTKTPVEGDHDNNNKYYVYQSTEENFSFTGWESNKDEGECRIPVYEEVMYDNMPWREWITNQSDVIAVIEAWNNDNHSLLDQSNRSGTPHHIRVEGANNRHIHLTIDNLYSTQQHGYGEGSSATGVKSGIEFYPGTNTSKSTLTIHTKGDNRFGNIRYWNGDKKLAVTDNENRLIFEGSGSLTVADVLKDSEHGCYYHNHFNSAIGATDHDPKGSEGIVINSGVIFAGTTAEENSSAIGGGGNGVGVITINGGTVTAVAHTTGTAIGGGIGFSSAGGPGYVTINGGNVYAYNLENPEGIPSAAIGGAGSKSSNGSIGAVTINNGNIYAYSVGGTAIGGGSSKSTNGGSAEVNISGGNIVAKSVAGKIPGSNTAGAGIGGGTGGSNADYGGSATITISGNPIIRTGSIGGGRNNNTKGGYIGTAQIDISGDCDIQAQFVMAAGAATKPKFEMSGGVIRNSDTSDPDFAHIQENGGAVYLEDGIVTISGGTIKDCSAGYGGAIYIMGDMNTTFNMSGGTISGCTAEHDGGAVYLKGGSVEISGGKISSNLANGGNGGAVYITGGNFSMPAGGNATISHNAAFSADSDVDNTLSGEGGSGGGIFVTSETNEVYVNIYSGSISDNFSDKVGGGISVDMEGHDEVAAKVTVGEAGSNSKTVPFISDNHTILMGGGLFARGSKAEITINGGYIKGNTISGYEANPDIANERGTVRLNGGDVETVTIYYYDNFEFYGEESSKPATQLVVKATNSLMHVPQEAKYTKLGYEFTGWNTRPDGKGRDYDENDREKNLMNLSEELLLYAQWSRK